MTPAISLITLLKKVVTGELQRMFVGKPHEQTAIRISWARKAAPRRLL